MELYSFDIFDTLITRTTAIPKGIFALLQERLVSDMDYSDIPEYVRRNFFAIRRNAEAMARFEKACCGIEDVTLAQIYEALALAGGLDAGQQARLLELELQIEKENIIGIPENIARLKELRDSGKRVVLISFMYLDEKQIRMILSDIDPVFYDIPIYMSCDYLAAKSSGRLFEKVHEAEGVAYSEWTHFGDNQDGDVAAPAKLGIHAVQYKYEQLKPYEQELIDTYPEDVSFQLEIGTARNTRLMDGSDSAAETIGISFSAPLLGDYCRWLLDESSRKGIRRLYYIARDGYILKAVSDRLIEAGKYDIETHYIYGSRRAWRAPSLSDAEADIYEIFMNGHPFAAKNMDELAAIIGLTADELIHFVPEQIMKIDDIADRAYFIGILLKYDQNFRRFVADRNLKTAETVVAYLKESIDTSDDNFAFVELTGSGMTQGCLALLMKSFYSRDIRTFFFKMDRINFARHCQFFDYIPADLDKSIVFEMLCRAPEGQTAGYEMKDGHAVPVFERYEVGAILAHGFNDYFNGILKYAGRFSSLKNKPYVSPKLLYKYYEYAVQRPDRELMDFIGDMPGGVTGREKVPYGFAPKLSDEDIRNIFLLRTGEPIEQFYKGTYLDYSILRCSEAQKEQIAYDKAHHDDAIGEQARAERGLKKLYLNREDEVSFDLSWLSGRVVLYAAGKYGHAMVTALQAEPEIRVVAWIDREPEKYAEEKFPVTGVGSLSTLEFDYIIIALKMPYAAAEAAQTLLELGVPIEKIVWVKPRGCR